MKVSDFWTHSEIMSAYLGQDMACLNRNFHDLCDIKKMDESERCYLVTEKISGRQVKPLTMNYSEQ